MKKNENNGVTAEDLVKMQLDLESQEQAEQEILVAAPEEKAKEEDESKKKEAELLARIEKEGGPSIAQIEAWKAANNGKIYFTYLGEGEVYFYKYCPRVLWKNALNEITSATVKDKEVAFEESIVSKCMIHPKFDVSFKATSPAGLIETLFKQIQFVSHFMPDEMAYQMIHKV